MPAKASGRVLAVLNLKGGVGKTTVSAHVMRVLYHRFRLKLLLVDLDPQFNLTQCLVNRSVYDKLQAAGKTIFAAFEPTSSVGLFDVATTHLPPPPPSDLYYRLRSFTDKSAFLDLLPGNFDLIKYSIVDDHTKLMKARGRFVHFVSSARSAYDVVVIDCNPSSSFITLCALHACTDILVPVRPDRYSVLGVELLADLLDRVPTIHPKPNVLILVNGVPTQKYNSRVENELRSHSVFGEKVLSSRLRLSRLLEANPKFTGFATDRPVPYRALLRTEISAITDEIAAHLGCA